MASPSSVSTTDTRTAAIATANAASRGTAWTARAAVGLACALMVNGVFDTMFSDRIDAVSFPLHISTDPLSGGLGVIAMCLAVVIACTAWRRSGRIPAAPDARVGAGVMAVLLAIPTILLFLEAGGAVPSAVGEASGLVLGASGVLLLALWAGRLAREGRTQSMGVLVLALTIDTLIDILASFALVDAAAVALVVAAGVASPCLLVSLGATAPVSAPASPQTTPSAGAAGRNNGAGFSATPRRTPAGGLTLGFSLLCIALYGFTMGRIQSMGSVFELSGAAALVGSYAVNIGALVTALLAAGLMRLRNPHMVARLFVFAFLAAALYLSGIFGTAIEPAGMVMMTVARFSIFVYIWLLTCDDADKPLQAALAFSAGWGAFTLANTVSTKIGLFAGGGPETSGAGFVAYSLAIVACLVALLVVEFAPRRRAGGEAPILDGNADAGADGWLDDSAGADKNGQPDNRTTGKDPLLERCRALAEQGGLTARELEVLVPLARGRSAAGIAAALGMSTETARTHIRHIYQKTGIHTREELLDLMERPADINEEK